MSKRKSSGENSSTAQKVRRQGDVTPPHNHAGESSKLPKDTPSKPRSGHSAAVINAAISMKTIGEERRNEMVDLYGNHHVHDNDSILNMAQPLDSYQRRAARNIARDAAEFLEAHLCPNSARLETTAPPPKQRKGEVGAKQTSSTSSSKATVFRRGLSSFGDMTIDEKQAGDNNSERVTLIDKMRDWLQEKSLRLENSLYIPIMAFVSYVALCVQAKWDTDGDRAGIRRLIRPVPKKDYKPDDSDDKTRIDIGLCSVGLNEPAPAASLRMPYHKLLAVIEAKVRSGNFDEAFPQLYGYIRQMYQVQHNLRSAWGFAICGHEVCVCHFGNDKAVSSKPMNVTTLEGRRAFIELLVNWSMCEDFQLGRDPTAVHLPDLGCWQIDCPDDTDCGIDAEPRRYYFNEVVCHADHLFGRHTRCFLATDIQPTVDSPLVPTVVIKDAWAFSERSISKDVRDEVKMLNKIRATLDDHIKPEDDIIYPKIVAGGRVWFVHGRSRIEDSTDTLYQEVKFADKDTPHFRVHRRIVMSQIGQRLHTLESVDEFITVVCDVMRCHNAIFKYCQILHRDISDNNILVVRQSGIARGLLIDFDCALDTSIERTEPPRPKMTGTLPFMSINNLSESNVKRTILDDYESILYLVCWSATLGIGSSQRHRKSKDLEKLPIAEWRKGGQSAIVRAKRDHFGTEKSLLTNIATYFSSAKDSNNANDDPDKKLLTRFVSLLRRIIFDNPSEDVGPECRGTSYIELRRVKSTWFGTDDEFLSALEDRGALSSARDEPEIINPFEKRVEKCDIIVKDLHVFIDGFWKFAMKRQNKPKPAPEEQVETAADDDKDDEDDAVEDDGDDDDDNS
ncbi:hypothetical protein GGH94_001899 [Coemansia aciculifera]|uniref:Fungal-type protein kinase domain-containing protein n=1 Tax=Coemansia aciculifera TaxID=417176 RepID=A0A9W8IJV8_9FUNG|nr:hypothetical protein GGH94_001899 [Coemansia aciculifera]